jgi:uncharacterized protein (DUF1800 family)
MEKRMHVPEPVSGRPTSTDASPIDNIDACTAAVGDAGQSQHPADGTDVTVPLNRSLPSAPPGRSPLDRRTLLRGAGLAALASAAGAGAALAGEHPSVLAQADPPPAMRSPRQEMWAAAGVEPPPPPEVIALNRMGFGPRPGDLAALMALGSTTDERLAAYVEQQLDPAAIDDSACDAQIAAMGLTTLTKSLAQMWQDHNRKENIDWGERLRPAAETRYATFMRAVYSKRQLTEVLADFWHNHFNVYGFDFWSGTTWVSYDRDVIRTHMLGNFRTLLEAVATSPAMLYYLDNVSNTSGGPNENFARESFELHTLGAMNYLGALGEPESVPKDEQGSPIGYIDTDVYGATRSFTGWRINEDNGNFFFDDKVHDKYAKTVLGVRLDDFLGVNDGRTVLNLLAFHRGTARHIATKLCRRFISDDPPQTVVDAAAAVFYAQRHAPDQLKQVVRTILLSPEFRTTWGQKVKRPYEYAASLLRAAGADFLPDESFMWIYGRCGQPLFQWQPPNGFPDRKEDWSSTMPLLQRWRLCNWLIDGWRYGGDGPNHDELRVRFDGVMPPQYNTAETIVDFWALRLLGRSLPPDERNPIVDFMAYGRSRTSVLPDEDIADRLRFMIGLIFMAPSFQWR